MKSCDVFRVQQLGLEPDPSLSLLSKFFEGAICASLLPSYPCALSGWHMLPLSQLIGQPVYKVVVSWLPWGERYWSCCNPQFGFCLAQTLSGSSQFLAGTFLRVSSVWSLKTCTCSRVVFHGELQFRNRGDELMRLGAAPSAFSPCTVGQYCLTKFGLTVLAFYPAATTPRNTVKPGGNLRRAWKWQTWKCMQVLYRSVWAYFTEERRRLLGSWEAAAVQCAEPQTAPRLVTPLPPVSPREQGVRALAVFQPCLSQPELWESARPQLRGLCLLSPLAGAADLPPAASVCPCGHTGTALRAPAAQPARPGSAAPPAARRAALHSRWRPRAAAGRLRIPCTAKVTGLSPELPRFR